MHRINHGDGNIADLNGAAFVHADAFDALGRLPPVHEIILSDEDHAVRLGQCQCVGGMVVVSVGQQDMGRLCDGCCAVFIRERRVLFEPRINEDHLICNFEPEASVSEPCDFHTSLSCVGARIAGSDAKAIGFEDLQGRGGTGKRKPKVYPPFWRHIMSIDTETARRVAKLARIKVEDAALPALAQEFSAILGFIEQLNEVDVEGIEPMTSVTPQRLVRRKDVVTDGNQQAAILKNAPDAREGFFAVPKVVE